MKTLFILFIIIATLFAFSASAEVLKVKFGTETCSANALGCIKYSNQTIYLSESLPDSLVGLVLAHEIGHWYMRGLAHQDYIDQFGNGTFEKLQEVAANRFMAFVWYGFSLTKHDKDFFNNLIRGQELILIYNTICQQ